MRLLGTFADDELLLTECAEDWLESLDRRGCPADHQAQRSLGCSVGSSEDRCCHVVLVACPVTLGQFGRVPDAESTRCDMDTVVRQSGEDPVRARHDSLRRGIVGEHREHHADFGRLERRCGSHGPEGDELVGALRCPVPDDDAVASTQQCLHHSASHVAESDETDVHRGSPSPVTLCPTTVHVGRSVPRRAAAGEGSRHAADVGSTVSAGEEPSSARARAAAVVAASNQIVHSLAGRRAGGSGTLAGKPR